jgi:esterase/lipase superfamily enzyme
MPTILYLSITYSRGKFHLKPSDEKKYQKSLQKGEQGVLYYLSSKPRKAFDQAKAFKGYGTYEEAYKALRKVDPKCKEIYGTPKLDMKIVPQKRLRTVLEMHDEIGSKIIHRQDIGVKDVMMLKKKATPRRGSGAPKKARMEPAPEAAPEAAPRTGSAPAPERHMTRAKPPEPQEPQAEAQNFVTVPVFYATDRARTGNTEPNDCFGGGRGELELGKCSVSIPLSHKVGEIERPHWWKLSFAENQADHVMVISVDNLGPDGFYNGIKDKVAGSPGKDAFIFVHGYNVTFAEAARRTAQIAHDLSFSGAPVMFSWPSKGTLEGYWGDEDDVRWAAPHLEEVIRKIRETSGAQKIHLIAHSMGNRALTEALDRIGRDAFEGQWPPPFNQVILAAPDIDAEIFREQIAPQMLAASKRITLYASSNDKALAASRKMRGDYLRAGETGEGLVIVDGIDTVDASDVGTDLLGHGYYAEALSLINDMYQLTENGLPPEKRNLREREKGSRKYWALPRTG